MITQEKLEEIVRDLTIGAGETYSTTNIIYAVEKKIGERLNLAQERIVQRTNHECQMRMEFP